jgi:outer membrane protein assembly factor BamB
MQGPILCVITLQIPRIFMSRRLAIIPRQLKAALVLAAVSFLTACQSQSASSITALNSTLLSQTKVDNASGQSVAYQIDVAHTGFARGPLRLPLKQLWSVDLGGKRGGVGYPVIVNGIVVVIANERLIALDEKTGEKLWVHRSPGGNGWVGQAYDNGIIFANSYLSRWQKHIGIYAFDERTGEKLWSAPTPGQSVSSSPPTAASGVVYAAAGGVGGTVYAFDESTGALTWTAPVNGADDSSPAVTSTGIFVSYACPQTYDLRPSDGQQIWQFSGPCQGGGGSTPVLYHDLLFVGDSQQSVGYNGLILNAKNGTIAGAFNAMFPPAFANKLGFFVNPTTLEAQSIPTMKQVWNAQVRTGDDYLTPPLVVGEIVYVETAGNNLLGYDIRSGKKNVDIIVPNSGYYRSAFAGLAFGDGELLVPNGPYLIAFQGS